MYTKDQYNSYGTTQYSSGYNKGVTDADNRANTNSTNYKTGYNAGYAAAPKNSLKTTNATVNVSTSSSYGKLDANGLSNGIVQALRNIGISCNIYYEHINLERYSVTVYNASIIS